MSREFIDAIASGNKLEAEDEFKNSISSKVGDALESRRKDISQTFAGNNEVVEEDSGEVSGPKKKAKRVADVALRFAGPAGLAIRGAHDAYKLLTKKGEDPGEAIAKDLKGATKHISISPEVLKKTKGLKRALTTLPAGRFGSKDAKK